MTKLQSLTWMLPKLTSWQYAQLEPLLSPSAQAAFANEKVRAAYQAFARLGRLQSMDKPEFMGERSGKSDVLGDIELIAYQVPLRFDTGAAVIKINLATDGKFYYIHHFSMQPDIFADSANGN